MYLPLVIGVVSCILCWFYIRWLKIKRYWSDRGVPHLPPMPLLGSFTFLQRENFGVWLRRMNEYFKTPYIGVWLFWRPALIINSPKIARNILVKDFNNFRNRFLSSGATDPIGGLNVFTLNDPAWSTIRRHLNSGFTAAKLRVLQNYMKNKTKELLQRIHNDRNIKIDLGKLYSDYVTDVIGTYVFGVRSDATLSGGGPLRKVTQDFSSYSLFKALSWWSIFFFPELVDIFRFKFFSTTSTYYVRKIFHAVAWKRKTNLGDRETKDFLDILLKIQNENESYTDELPIAQAAILLLAGTEATGATIMYLTYELAYYPELQEKLYQELSEAAKQYGSEDFDMDFLSKLTYLNCVIKEGIRKYITLTWLDRIAEKEYKIDDKLTIEAGTVVYINLIGMQYDPKYFPEPYKFDPDRFLPENKDRIEPYSYISFGEGPRACVAKRFGITIIQFAMASLFLNYKVRPCPNMPHPADIKINNNGILHLPADTLNVEFVPRK